VHDDDHARLAAQSALDRVAEYMRDRGAGGDPLDDALKKLARGIEAEAAQRLSQGEDGGQVSDDLLRETEAALNVLDAADNDPAALLEGLWRARGLN